MNMFDMLYTREGAGTICAEVVAQIQDINADVDIIDSSVELPQNSESYEEFCNDPENDITIVRIQIGLEEMVAHMDFEQFADKVLAPVAKMLLEKIGSLEGNYAVIKCPTYDKDFYKELVVELGCDNYFLTLLYEVDRDGEDEKHKLTFKISLVKEVE